MKMYKTGLALSVVLATPLAAQAADAPFTVSFEGTQFSIVEQAPHLNETPLQVFGVFEYKKDDVFSGADVEMDEGLHGLIQDIRKSHKFQGRLAETVLLKPTNSTVLPKQVLVMGLGDRKGFKATDMNQVGATDIGVVCRAGLTEFAHASDVQDGGGKADAGVVAEHVLTGMIQAMRLQKYLSDKGMADTCKVSKIVYLAGPKFFKETTAALTKVTTAMATK